MKLTRQRMSLIGLLFLFLMQTAIPILVVDHQRNASAPTPIDTMATAQISTATIMRGEVTVTKTDQAFEGYNLFVLRERNITTPNNNQTLIIADMDGNVLYEWVAQQRGLYELADVSVEFVTPSLVLIGVPFDSVLLNLNNNSERRLGFHGHHEYEYNPNNDTVFTFNYHRITEGDTDCLYDMLYEFDLNGNIVWELDVSTFISSDMWCPFGDMFMEALDITHSNTAFYDADEDIIYYNARNVNTFYKIDHATGEVIWGLGEYGNFTMYNARGEQVDHLFFHPHAVELADDNTFILFDNDHHDQNRDFGLKSRILEITIDEETMEAFETFSWEGPDDYYSFLWGDAHRLPNGNRLGTFGAAQHPFSDTGAHLVEVTEAGNIAWGFTFHNSEEYRYGVYRMERFRYSPVLSSPADVHLTDEQEVVLDWQAFYNFRPKRIIVGEYNLSRDGVVIEAGTLSYDKLWRPTDLTFNMGLMEDGQYEFTLSVADEEGHISNDSIIVTIGPLPLIPLEVVVPLAAVGVIAIVVIIVIRKKLD